MGHYLGSKCKLCRSIGEKLLLKGEKCIKKCTFDKKNRQSPPGQHGNRRRSKFSDYGLRLHEKQKTRFIAGVREEQFRKIFSKAERKKGITGENLLRLLEMRLDNVIQRLGFASSKSAARQLVSHGHFAVNSRLTNVPSFVVKPGDIIKLNTKMWENVSIKHALEDTNNKGRAAWLSFDLLTLTGKILREPTRDEMSYPINEQLVVEFYSR